MGWIDAERAPVTTGGFAVAGVVRRWRWRFSWR